MSDIDNVGPCPPELKMAEDDGMIVEVSPCACVWVPGGRLMDKAARMAEAIEIARKNPPWVPMHLRQQLYAVLN